MADGPLNGAEPRPTRADGYPVVAVPPGRFARLHDRLRGRLPIWVVYRPVTREYLGVWVARMHITLPEARSTRFVITHDTLAELRDLLPAGLTCFARDPRDAPEIEESWM